MKTPVQNALASEDSLSVPIQYMLEGEGEERCVGECLFSRNGALRLEGAMRPCFATPAETSLVSMPF
jgi:hypothetical protein